MFHSKLAALLALDSGLDRLIDAFAHPEIQIGTLLVMFSVAVVAMLHCEIAFRREA